MKIYTEESEGQIKITDTGIDISLDIIGIVRKWGLVRWIRFCDFANIIKPRIQSFPYRVHIYLFA